MGPRTPAPLSYAARHGGRTVLVTEASGYVGGRLVTELLAAGSTVRASSRNVSSLQRFDWRDEVEAVQADLTDLDDSTRAMSGVDVVFYLVHPMGERGRIARILLAGQTPTLVFRAATLIGSGSASFKIIRHLTERLPLMIAPAWINNRIEPLAIRDALYYLVAAADLPQPVNREYDIGCGHTYRFSDLLRIYGQLHGLRRRIIAVPLPLPVDRLSGGWIGLVTPVPSPLAVPLAQSMAENAVTEEHGVKELIPDPPGGLADYPHAVELAVKAEHARGVPPSWDRSWSQVSDAADSRPTDPEWAGRTIHEDTRSAECEVPAEQVWKVLEGIGGTNGWYSSPTLWRIRGVLDRLLGGPGLGGRRDPRRLAVGDRVDWWRVAEISPSRRLVLAAEMKVNGRAWLIMELQDRGDGGCTYVQRALYAPTGLTGRLYWWSVAPFHAFIFPVMVRTIVATARQGER